MSRNRAKNRMKVILGGKQLSFIRDTEEILKFLESTAKTSSQDPSIIDARLEACSWCFKLLSEEEDHLLWILENIPQILARQSECSGSELEKRSQLIMDALEDYRAWSSDPFGWEREQENLKFENPKKIISLNKMSERTLTFPVRSDFCIEVKVPEGGISTEEFLRLGLFLYPYCNDLDLTKTFSWLTITDKS